MTDQATDDLKEEGVEETEEKKEDKKEVKEEEYDPAPRKSAKDYIIERKNKKIEKLEKKEEPEGGTEEGEEELSDGGKTAINKAVKENLKPVLDSVKTQSDEQELAEVLAKYPDAKDIVKDIRRVMEKPAYKSASVEFIYNSLMGRKAMLQKAKDDADDSADNDRTGGHSKRSSGDSKIPDVDNMSDGDFDKLKNKVKSGGFK